ncbi:MAG: hypothetical protein ACNA7O_19785 [Rhodobacterales bacterium]
MIDKKVLTDVVDLDLVAVNLLADALASICKPCLSADVARAGETPLSPRPERRKSPWAASA